MAKLRQTDTPAALAAYLNKKMHPSGEVERFQMDNLSRRRPVIGDVRRVENA